LYISAEGNDSNSNTVKANPIYATTYSITTVGKVIPSSSSKVSNSVFAKSTTNNEVTQWTVVVKDEEMSLKEIELT
jgi:hypothetical protein